MCWYKIFLNECCKRLFYLNQKGDFNGIKTPCLGDTGSALFYKTQINDKEKYVIVGLVSYTYIMGCSAKSYV